MLFWRYVKARVYLVLTETLYMCCLALDKFIRLLGALMVCLAIGLFGFLTYTYLSRVYPLLESGKVFMPAGIFCVANAIFNYIQTIRISAGSPPLAEDALEEGDALIARLAREGVIDTCGKCGRLRPPRTHHCSICGVCYLKLDHHCPWTSFIRPNCVGHGNYRFFWLFLMFTWLSSCFGAINFSIALFALEHFKDDDSSVFLSFAICAMLALAVGGLFFFHVYLVMKNMTTIESQGPNDSRAARARGELVINPYNLGWRTNFKEVFGPYEIYQVTWTMSWLAIPPTGDGMSFPGVGSTEL